MDASDVLTDEQRSAGLRLLEPDDHLVMLVRDGHLLRVFSQNVPRSVILGEAEFWRERKGEQSADAARGV
jgi:hypothetical protein